LMYVHQSLIRDVHYQSIDLFKNIFK